MFLSLNSQLHRKDAADFPKFHPRFDTRMLEGRGAHSLLGTTISRFPGSMLGWILPKAVPGAIVSWTQRSWMKTVVLGWWWALVKTLKDQWEWWEKPVKSGRTAVSFDWIAHVRSKSDRARMTERNKLSHRFRDAIWNELKVCLIF